MKSLVDEAIEKLTHNHYKRHEVEGEKRGNGNTKNTMAVGLRTRQYFSHYQVLGRRQRQWG